MTVYAGRKSAPTSAYNAAVLADSPITYWRCNEPVGSSTAVDSQSTVNGTYQTAIINGIGRKGAITGDPTSGSVGLATGSSSTGITLPSTSAFSVGPPFTIEFWVMTKTTGAATLTYLVNPSASSLSNGYGVGIGHTTAGQIDILNSDAASWLASGVTVNDGAWHHIVVTFSSGTAVTVYKDGSSAGTVTLSNALTPYSGTGMKLLAPGASNKAVFMSEIATYGASLSSGRVAAHYAAAQVSALSDRVLLMTASATWEDGGCVEPNLYWDGSQWCMIYRGGQHPTTVALGYATCSGADPTIAGNWTKYSGNPIIGGGAGGFSDHCYCPSIYIEAGTLYVFFADYANGNIYVASGTDALHLGTPAVVLSTGSTLGNMWVTKTGANYTMAYEQRNPLDSNHWQLGVATASTADGTYTSVRYPLTLSDGNTDHNGPWFYKDGGGTYRLWYHGSYYGSGLPSQIYKTTSTDLTTFTTPQLQFKRSFVAEYDQTADPQLVVPGEFGAPSSGPVYVMWDGDDNVSLTAALFISRSGVVPLVP